MHRQHQMPLDRKNIGQHALDVLHHLLARGAVDVNKISNVAQRWFSARSTFELDGWT